MSEKIADMKANIVRLLSENAELKRERDEAQKELLYYKTRYELLKDSMGVLTAEREDKE